MTLNLTSYFLNTDNIDNNMESIENDRLLCFGSSLQYSLLRKSLKQEINKYYRGVDFDDIVLSDSDGDGINDLYDECFGTPIGVKVDIKGCPFDSDKDAIPDYLDKEENTHYPSDLEGVGIEPATVESLKQAVVADSLESIEKMKNLEEFRRLEEERAEKEAIDALIKEKERQTAAEEERVRMETEQEMKNEKNKNE